MRISLLILLSFLAAQPQGRSRQEATRVPAAVLNAERAWAGADVLLPLTRTADPAVTRAALRALGRLEDVRLVPQLLPFVDHQDAAIRGAAAVALAQTLIEFKPDTDATMIAEVGRRLRAHLTLDDSSAVSAVGVLQYGNPDDVTAAETALVSLFEATASDRLKAGLHNSTAAALESLLRRNARVRGVAVRPETIERLETAVKGLHLNDDDPSTRRYAFLALTAGGMVSSGAERAAISDADPQVRRLGVRTLGGAAFTIDEDARASMLRDALTDQSILVRFEAAGAYAKKSAATAGCAPLLSALQDPAPYVVNAALDALGTACPDDQDVTVRLAAESRAPSANDSWQRAAHAYLSLARRDRERAAIVTQAFARSPVWQVRMYAARAAAAMDDETTLGVLALDDNDNVREAALEPLQGRIGDRADAALMDALKRSDPQLLRTASTLLKKRPPAPATYRALAEAFTRLSRLQSETTRDARLALLDAMAVHGGKDDAGELAPFLRDVDPRVAGRLSALLAGWGAQRQPDLIPVLHDPAAPVSDLRQCVAVGMKGGGTFRLKMENDAAPVTVGSFLQLALERRLYDGLTFHRVEPNFVVQGGSPGANEYSSALTRYLRDEIGLRNDRGAVGLSTRGRNTADGQIYLMLVDDPRLDGRFTIFAHVFPDDMNVVDNLQEGAQIERIARVACGR